MTIRKSAVQLAAMVDLLFVIVFLQFAEMEVLAEKKNTEAKREKEVLKHDHKKILASLNKVASEKNDLEASNQGLLKQITEMEKKIEKEKEKNQILNKDIVKTQKQIKDMDAASDVLLKSLNEFLKAFKDSDLENATTADGVPDKNKIIELLKELQGKGADKLALELKKTAELKKQIDIFEVHIFEDDRIRLKLDPRKPKTFVLPEGVELERVRFLNDQMLEYIRQENLKEYVFVLFTYDNCKEIVFNVTKASLNESKTWILTERRSKCNVFVCNPIFMKLTPEP